MKVFEAINAKPNKSMIYTRLGYAKTKTQLSEKKMLEIDEIIYEGLSKAKIVGGYRILNIESIEHNKITLAEGIVFESLKLTQFLKEAKRVAVMFATAGKDITEEIALLFENNNASKALIYDAVASEAVDSALDFIMEYIKAILIREGQTLTKKRYSAGYGDFELSQQEQFFEILKLENYGIRLNEKYIMIPEKSVTAIAGVI